MRHISRLFMALILVALPNIGASAAPSDAGVIYEDPTGVSVEMTADGRDWVRIRSIGEATLLIGDRKDVQDATRKATLLAKAEVAKFLKERISTQECLEEITKTVAQAKSGQLGSAERTTVETMVVNIRNSANEILKGVLTLEQQTDMSKRLVRVTVGVSRNTMRTADTLRREINRDHSTDGSSGSRSGDAAEPQSEIRRSKNFTNF